MILFYWLIGILPLLNHPLWGRTIGPFSIVELLGVICFIYAVIHVLSNGNVPRLLGARHLMLFYILYLLAILSVVTNHLGNTVNLSSFTIYTSSFLLMIITVSVVDTLQRLRWTVLVMIGSYGFASLYVIREWQVGHRIWAGFRPGWIVGDANYFSAAAVVPFILAILLAQSKGPRWQRLFCWGCLLLLTIALTFCASRGGFLGLGTAALVAVWHTKKRIRNFILIVVLVLPLSIILPISPLNRLLHPASSDVASERFHLLSWSAGLKMIESHPLLGVGLGNFKAVMLEYAPPGTSVDYMAHNMFVEVAAELGLPAFLIFLSIFFFSFRDLGRIRRTSTSPVLVKTLASGLQAGLVGLATAGSFVSAEYQKTTWFPFAVIACLIALARHHVPRAENQLELGELRYDVGAPKEILHEENN